MPVFRLTPDRDGPQGWRILTIGGIPVYVEPSFILFIGLITMLNADAGGIDVPRVGLICAVIFGSILVHELGHALSSKWFGLDNIRIALVMFGGYATHTPTTRGRSIVISLMGPFFGLLLAAAAFGLSRTRLLDAGPEGAMEFVLGSLLLLNLFWSLFNLIPVHPMDGGQVLFHTLTYWLEPTRALRAVVRLSMVLCVVLGLLAYRVEPFIALFFGLFFIDNWRVAQFLS